jgi:hypothetical protein
MNEKVYTINGLTGTAEALRAVFGIGVRPPVAPPAPTITAPPPITAPQTPAPAPLQPNLFHAKERARKGVFGTLPQFAGLKEPRAKSAMMRLFQIASSAFPRFVLKSAARDSLGWSNQTAWEYACALEDAGLIERRGDSIRAKTTDIPFAEATIAEFVYLRDANCHHYVRIKDRA